MVSFPTVLGLSCGFVLCLGLSQAVQADNASSSADDKLKAEQTDRRQGGQDAGEKQMKDEGGDSKGINTISGEVLRVEGANYFIKGSDGKEVRLHTDSTTQMAGIVGKGDRIEAKVNDQKHALSMNKTSKN